jgi:hypothetical protein
VTNARPLPPKRAAVNEELICQLCGWEPARWLTIRRHVGMLLMQKFVKLQAPLCRECGQKKLVEYTTRTLWQGWWGYISFFVNWFVLVSNLFAWLKLRSMPRRQFQAQPLPDVPQGISEERWRSVFGEPKPETD